MDPKINVFRIGFQKKVLQSTTYALTEKQLCFYARVIYYLPDSYKHNSHSTTKSWSRLKTNVPALGNRRDRKHDLKKGTNVYAHQGLFVKCVTPNIHKYPHRSKQILGISYKQFLQLGVRLPIDVKDRDLLCRSGKNRASLENVCK